MYSINRLVQFNNKQQLLAMNNILSRSLSTKKSTTNTNKNKQSDKQQNKYNEDGGKRSSHVTPDESKDKYDIHNVEKQIQPTKESEESLRQVGRSPLDKHSPKNAV